MRFKIREKTCEAPGCTEKHKSTTDYCNAHAHYADLDFRPNAAKPDGPGTIRIKEYIKAKLTLEQRHE